MRLGMPTDSQATPLLAAAAVAAASVVAGIAFALFKGTASTGEQGPKAANGVRGHLHACLCKRRRRLAARCIRA